MSVHRTVDLPAVLPVLPLACAKRTVDLADSAWRARPVAGAAGVAALVGARTITFRAHTSAVVLDGMGPRPWRPPV